MRWNGRTRCALVSFLRASLQRLSWRLIYLQMVMHKHYSEVAAENVGRNIIPAERGAIYDTHNEVPAQNVLVSTVVADGTLINSPGALVPLPAQSCAFRLPKSRKDQLPSAPTSCWKRGFPEAEARALEESLRAAKLPSRSLRTRHSPDLSEWSNALSRCRLHRFSAARHSGSRGVDGSISAGGGRLSLHRA